MREIKFRGRGAYQRSVWYVGDLVRCDDGRITIRKDEANEFYVDPATVGQYTGLKDADGREIYEGDVLEFAVFDYQGLDVEYRGVVEWCGSRFIVSVCLVLAPKTWRKIRDYEESYYDLDWILDQDDEVKIIGNVHDNSDLLECKP